MKRTTLLLVPTLLLTVLVLAVAAEIPAEPGPPRGVQKRLERYRFSSFADTDTRILQVTRARRPWNLTRDLNWLILGDSVYFQTDHPLTGRRSDGPSPLPFPPKEVWCALLESKSGTTDAQSYSVVLVGLHMDMYSGDWIIHQAPSEPFSTVGDALSGLGCGLELE